VRHSDVRRKGLVADDRSGGRHVKKGRQGDLVGVITSRGLRDRDRFRGDGRPVKPRPTRLRRVAACRRSWCRVHVIPRPHSTSRTSLPQRLSPPSPANDSCERASRAASERSGPRSGCPRASVKGVPAGRSFPAKMILAKVVGNRRRDEDGRAPSSAQAAGRRGGPIVRAARPKAAISSRDTGDPARRTLLIRQRQLGADGGRSSRTVRSTPAIVGIVDNTAK